MILLAHLQPKAEVLHLSIKNETLLKMRTNVHKTNQCIKTFGTDGNDMGENS